jgi:hypothetical protein
MFFESRVYEIIEKDNTQEVVNYLKSDDWQSYQAVGCKNKNGDLVLAVPDGHIDSPIDELAIVNQTQHRQIESLTWGWLKDDECLRYIEDCFNSDINMGKAYVASKPSEIVNQMFICGCCGEDFLSDGEYQERFDQDAGYGICPDCEDNY